MEVEQAQWMRSDTDVPDILQSQQKEEPIGGQCDDKRELDSRLDT